MLLKTWNNCFYTFKCRFLSLTCFDAIFFVNKNNIHPIARLEKKVKRARETDEKIIAYFYVLLFLLSLF